ncbi:MAG: ankyrin repeat domain-containing protein [Coxiellaceae bacterium]|nr:MAG: ankyrin repeat domain-containing protein [Coxiellaceae bacterium]
MVDKPSSKKSLWPLLLAFQNKQVLIIEILWNAGANIDLKDKSGRTLREMIFDLSVYPDSDVEYKAFRGF